MKRFTAAAVQFAPVPMSDPDCVQKNLDRAHAWLCAAKRQSQAELFVLPESFTTGFTPVGGRRALCDQSLRGDKIIIPKGGKAEVQHQNRHRKPAENGTEGNGKIPKPCP